MLLAIETLLQQHLLFLTGHVRVLDDVDVLIDLLGDHAVLLVAYWAHHLPLLLLSYLGFFHAFIANDVTAIEHARVPLIVVN